MRVSLGASAKGFFGPTLGEGSGTAAVHGDDADEPLVNKAFKLRSCEALHITLHMRPIVI